MEGDVGSLGIIVHIYILLQLLLVTVTGTVHVGCFGGLYGWQAGLYVRICEVPVTAECSTKGDITVLLLSL